MCSDYPRTSLPSRPPLGDCRVAQLIWQRPRWPERRSPVLPPTRSVRLSTLRSAYADPPLCTDASQFPRLRPTRTLETTCWVGRSRCWSRYCRHHCEIPLLLRPKYSLWRRQHELMWFLALMQTSCASWRTVAGRLFCKHQCCASVEE
jgi:hypothetical protein